VHHVYMRKKAARVRKKPKFPVTKMRLWREDREMTLEDVGEAVGLSHAQLGRIENGHQEYKQSLVLKLAKHYGIDSVSLLERDPRDARAIWATIAKADENQLKDIERYAEFVTSKR
jgi:transcriptional regulator with XRE-family HTH domain